MVYKNNVFFLLVCAGFFVLSVASANDNLLWRIENKDVKTEIIPPFENEDSPFPILVKEEPVPEVLFEPEVNTGPSEDEKRAMLASDILADIRNLLATENVFNPDITTAKVAASMFGENGQLVLINNDWLKTGDSLSVPVKAKGRLNDLIETLTTLDPALSSIIKNEVDEKFREAQDLELKIDEIGETYINLTDDRGSLHVINYNIGS